MLGRSQINVAPILGVLLAVFVGFSTMLRYEPIEVPRMLDEACECPPSETTRPIGLHLRADGSMEVHRAGRVEHIEAPQVAATLAALPALPADDPPARVVQLQADDGVSWGDFVDVVSSVRHITGGEVAVVSVEE